MEELLAQANLVADSVEKPDILDAIVGAMLRTVHRGMRAKVSYFPAVWQNASEADIKTMQEMMFSKIKHCITAKVLYCANLPWHGIHLSVADVVQAFLIIIQTRGSLVWGEACKTYEMAWLSQADGQWNTYVHKTYKGVQVTDEQCKAFIQNVWESLPGAAVERVQRNRKRAADNEAVMKAQSTQIDAMQGMMKAQEKLVQELVRHQGQVSRSSSSSGSESESEDGSRAPKPPAKAAAPKAAPKAATPKAAPKAAATKAATPHAPGTVLMKQAQVQKK